ncbi:hypothetical protein ACFC1W_07360 [Microbacterium sp. NPDC056003]|uniref:hypothetical protein n=1 Tax=Microbacterium sp. NPDC056003 TaxID=3345676 RepID=UPI0035D88CB2
MYRGQLERKRKQRVDAERKAGEYRAKESKHRTDAAKAAQAASKTKSVATMNSKRREADRREKDAATAGAEAARWQSRASGYAREEASIASKLARRARGAGRHSASG